MFRKKKDVGTVIVLDDNPSVDAREELGLSGPRGGDPTSDDMEHMTSQQLEQLAIGTAKSGKDATARALRMATEAREIGANTAATMQQQTVQLEKLSEDIEVVHDYLDKSERTIDKMTKSKLVRMFQRKKPAGKSLEKVKANKKEQEAREELRSKGLESIDVQGMQGQDGSVSMGEIQRATANDEATEARRGLFAKKNKDPPTRTQARHIEEDYSGYSKGVAKVLQQQDEDLDQIGDVLSDMHSMAKAMNNELEYQDKLIGEVQDFSAETSRRAKDNAKRIAKLK